MDHVFVRDGQKLLLSEPADILAGGGPDHGGYVDLDGDNCWWIPAGRVFLSPTAEEELTYARQHFFLPHRYRDPFGHETQVSYDDDDLLVTQTRDAVGNTVTAVNDYRVLQPQQVTDPNGNCSKVVFDTLGLVVGTAIMGKPAPAEAEGDLLDESFTIDLTQTQIEDFFAQPRVPATGDSESQAAPIVHKLLGNATTRIVYDLDRFQRTRKDNPDDPNAWEPPFAAIIARETHVSELADGEQSKLQVSFSYSDGFGREIQKKIQAEPGPLEVGGEVVNPRWVGSGWTVFNNKGKPVRQYEPFFSKRELADGTFVSDHRFEFGNKVGVSPILFYDPLERVVATLHPNHTWEKVVFDPWQQKTYDVTDTVLNANGSTNPTWDEDVGGFFARLPEAEYLPTWYEQRTALQADHPERVAAEKAAAYADTPTVAYFDTLGRTFLTIAHNKVDCPGHSLDGTEAKYHTRVEIDIEGNQRAVRDADQQGNDRLGRVVMVYDYDMLGNRIHQQSMEAGERWMLNDAAGKPIRSWDSRGHTFRTEYDELRRPTGVYLHTGTAPEMRVQWTEYGEGEPDAVANNLRGRVVRVRDGAGMVTTDKYDFKGNLLRSVRQLATDYRTVPDWLGVVALEGEFTTRTTYDALNRPTEQVTPDGSRTRPGYNEASLLEAIDVNLRGETDAAQQPVWTPFVTNIDYNAKGQRTLIEYGNKTRTEYEYDPLTFRLSHLLTRRDVAAFDDCPQPPPDGWPGCQVQNLHYTYDPAGNITHIRDDAQQTIFFRNKRVEPSSDYTYDAIYRLIEATGREHLSQGADGTMLLPTMPTHTDAPRTRLNHPGDGNAMGTYREEYVYDAVGNFQEVIHRGVDPANPGWRRPYHYHEPSQLEDGKFSNRLSHNRPEADGPPEFTYDAHGNMETMPHLPLMRWDYADRLAATSGQVRDDGGTPETTYYVYDATGQRVRKVTEGPAGPGVAPARREERIYLGGYEVYRKYGDSGTAVALERQTLRVMDDKQRVAVVETRTTGDDGSPGRLIRYQLGNHLGSAALELDGAGQVISYEEYYPYGSTSYQAVRSETEAPKRYRYTGKERDEETGLAYHGARYYAPWLGRWTSCDPAGTADGLDVYQYARGNPANLSDTRGTQSLNPFGNKEGIEAVEHVMNRVTEEDVLADVQHVFSGAPPSGKLGAPSITEPPPNPVVSGVLNVAGGTASVIGGMGGAAASAAVSSTGVGAAVGVPLGLASAGAISGGAITIGLGLTQFASVMLAESSATELNDLQGAAQAARDLATPTGKAFALASIASGGNPEDMHVAAARGATVEALAGFGLGLGTLALKLDPKLAAVAQEGALFGTVPGVLPSQSSRAAMQGALFDINAKNVVELLTRSGPNYMISRQAKWELGQLNQAGLAQYAEANPILGWRAVPQRPFSSRPDFVNVGAETAKPFGEVTSMKPTTLQSHEGRWYTGNRATDFSGSIFQLSEGFLYPAIPSVY